MNVVRLIEMKPDWAVIAEKRMSELSLQKDGLLEVFGVKTVGAVGHYFNGRRKPSIDSIIELSKKLDISIVSLLNLEQEINAGLELKCDNERFFVDAISLLTRTAKIDNDDLEVFLKVLSQIGAPNIIKATNALSQAGNNSTAQIDAVLNIQSFIKKAG